MRIIIEKWNRFLTLMGIEEKDRKLFYYYVFGAVVGILIIKYIPDLMATIPVVLLLGTFLFVLFMWGYAGVIVLRSVIPASVALTLLLFLGIEYCDVAPEYRIADESLRFILGFGLLYVAAQFGIALFKELVGNKNAEKESQRKGVIRTLKEINRGRHEPLALMLLGVVVAMFTFHFGMVVVAIAQNMCIY